MKILLELRPALDGHAGIPQETRLLFRGLAHLHGVKVDGLIQSSNVVLAQGLPASDKRRSGWTMGRRTEQLARVVVSLLESNDRGRMQRVRRALRAVAAPAGMVARTMVGMPQPLTHFEPARYEDFVWRAMFAKTLPPEDFETVTRAHYRVAQVPWSSMHAGGLFTRPLGGALYPRLSTRGYDVFLTETPYPGRVARGTQMVVRYHDAVPLLMPHTISNRSFHQASHYHALRRNVSDGAWFACVSDASRQDLISIFPQVEPRTVTIPNMVSHAYFQEDAPPARVTDILRTRASRKLEESARSYVRRGDTQPACADPARPVQYLLMVSTLEPRKNHLTLLNAWEQLRANGFPNLQLVLVGALGWDCKAIVERLLPWVAQGNVHVLEDVPAAELRLLYRHANATVCPSYGEGFGFSGVEAMCCGGAVIASSIPAHREVYADAVDYFNPYSVGDLMDRLNAALGERHEEWRAEMVRRGQSVALRYRPESVLPQWEAFLHSLGAPAQLPRPNLSAIEVTQ